MKVDLSSIPSSKFEPFYGMNWQKYYKIVFNLEMRIVDEIIKFAVMDGKRYSEVEAKFH